MKEDLVSIGNDFWIEDDNDSRIFKVDGKAMRVRETLLIEDRQENTLCKTQERKLHIKDTMEIESSEGHSLATIKKAIVSPVHDRFSVKVTDGSDLDVKGNILDHEYKVEAGRDSVAQISKKWFRVRDTYGVEIEPGQNDVLILAITAALDIMTAPNA